MSTTPTWLGLLAFAVFVFVTTQWYNFDFIPICHLLLPMLNLNFLNLHIFFKFSVIIRGSWILWFVHFCLLLKSKYSPLPVSSNLAQLALLSNKIEMFCVGALHGVMRRRLG